MRVWIAVLAGIAAALPAGAQTIRADFPITNGTVNAAVVMGGRLYLGGSFTSVGLPTGSATPVDAASGAVLPGFPVVNGQVNAIASDGAGGWYLGGAFTSVGGLPRANLAHVRADLSVAPWNPGADAAVRCLAASGSLVYAGGDFTAAGGQPRSDLAAIDAATGLATPWNPAANGSVRAVAVAGGVVYAGGSFTGIGGQPRNRIAALDAASGLATAWDANANSTVRGLVVDGATVYACGDFLSIGGQSRARIAALDASTALATPWNPSANNPVMAIAVSGGLVYAGGTFTSIGGQLRTRLAAIDANGFATTWNPIASGQVLALAVDAGTVYVGGDFLNVGSQPRSRLAALDPATGNATAWDPSAYGTVMALAAGTGTVYAGGSFNGMGGFARGNLAAIDVASGAVSEWSPNADGAVLVLAGGGGTIWAGGTFTHVGGQARVGLAAVDTSAGLATPFDVSTDGQVSALAIAAGTLYAGGAFLTVAGQPRSDLAAIDIASGTLTSWNPGADGQVFALEAGPDVLYAGGSFTTLGGAPRDNLAAVGLASGTVTGWNPDANGTIRALELNCGTVYAAGFFTSLAGQSRSRIAAIDAGSAAPTGWNPGANGPVFALHVSAGVVYAGGAMSAIGGVARNRIASLDALTGAATPWDPGANNVVRTLEVEAGAVYAGGSFTAIGPTLAENVAAISADASVTCPALAISPSGSLSAARVGSAYALTFNASGGSPPRCLTPGAGTLPAGLTFDPATGQLAGTPSAAGTFAFTIVVSNAQGCSGSAACTLLVRPPCGTIAIAPTSLPAGRAGVPLSDTLVASGGVAPYAFSLAAGALPGGVALGADGVLAGMPAGAGTWLFSVRVTDHDSCFAAQACTLTVLPSCGTLAIAPPALPDGWIGGAYDQTFSASGGTAPYAWSVAGGVLPSGLALATSGRLQGTPDAAGRYTFTIGASDSGGCVSSRSYTVTVFDSAPVSAVAPGAASACIGPANPCVSVPFVLARAESLPARATSVTFRIDTTRITLCTPGDPGASIHPGPWLQGFRSSFLITDQGGGAYTVDQSILGMPCGITTGGVLFTVDLRSSGADGPAAVTLLAVHARGCDNQPMPVGVGPAGAVLVDNAGTTPISDLAGVQVRSGNGGDSLTAIRVTWSTGGAGTVSLYRAPFGTYPRYDADGPISPPDPSLAPGPPWTLVSAGAASGLLDRPPARGFWYYAAQITDSCGTVSASSNRSAGALDYHLGDVSNGLVAGRGDDAVTTADVSLLGTHYGIGEPAITARNVAFLDVGPTTDGQPTSRPTPDHHLDFEDLMMFSLNFRAVSAPQAAARPAGSARPTPVVADAAPAAAESLAVEAPSLVEAGAIVTATLRMSAAGRMRGFSARLAWDPAVVEPLETVPGSLPAGALALSPGPGVLDAVCLGAPGAGLAGGGTVGTVRFRALRAGSAAIRLAEVRARDAGNHRLDPATLAVATHREAPDRTVLFAPAPNPSHGSTRITFALSRPGAVTLELFAVDGRRVTTLASGAREAGAWDVVWDGRDHAGNVVAPGIYFLRLVAPGASMRRTIVRLP